MPTPSNQDPSKSLTIAGVEIPCDEFGRYELNALQRISPYAGNPGRVPSRWLETKTAQDLIKQVDIQNRNSGSAKFESIKVINGGPNRGAYAEKRIAIAFAAWLDAEFHLIVLDAFIERGQSQRLPAINDPSKAALIQALIDIDRIEQGQVAIKQRQEEMSRQLQENTERTLFAIKSISYMTIREYVHSQWLTRQLPTGSAQQAYGRYLSGYCLEKGIPLRRITTENQYQEYQYPIQVLQDTLGPWLARRNGQIAFNGRNE